LVVVTADAFNDYSSKQQALNELPLGSEGAWRSLVGI
jgi:hypothetical protein